MNKRRIVIVNYGTYVQIKIYDMKNKDIKNTAFNLNIYF